MLRTLQDDVLGVRVVAPGAARARHLDTGDHADERVEVSSSPSAGRSRSRGTANRPGHFSLDVTIPVNVVADDPRSRARISDVSDGHRKLTDDPGVTAVHESGGEVVLTVGAGHYELHQPARKAVPTNPFPWTVFVFAIVGAFAFAQLGAMRMRRRRGLAHKPDW